MEYKYKPSKVCAHEFIFNIENNIITSFVSKGGCPGNLIGISKLLINMPIDEVINKFKGVKCGLKPTSCPDQIAIALEKFINK
ncbi:MAG: TIGR03905 family TSCPD domain-containing protein [Mycoplasmataceae bacterium]|jgi:uncharacterized protein (TIGR03905 family)|nr:TIGR03905 family TSCPD domain-containing protein [Mycoplasmataceae bacterium]